MSTKHHNYKITQNILKALGKPTTHGQPFAYVCCICRPMIAIKEPPITEKLSNSRRNSTGKTNDTIRELRSKLDNATLRIQQKEIELQDQQRNIQILSQSATGGDVNAAIEKFNEQLGESTATIAKLIAGKTQLIHENNEKGKIIENLRQHPPSTSTPGQSNAKRQRQTSEDLQGFINNETLMETMKDMLTPIALSIKKIEDRRLSGRKQSGNSVKRQRQYHDYSTGNDAFYSDTQSSVYESGKNATSFSKP